MSLNLNMIVSISYTKLVFDIERIVNLQFMFLHSKFRSIDSIPRVIMKGICEM